MSDLPFDVAEQPTARTVVGSPKRCRRHRWITVTSAPVNLGAITHTMTTTACIVCLKPKDETLSRRGRNSRKRGNAAELDVARAIGGQKMGPLGLPWDVEVAGYARLQVRKYANPQSLRAIAAELARIAKTPGIEQPGYVWLEPGRNGEKLIVFRLREFTEHHGEMRVEE
jgi:hypothetical protein